MVCVPHHASEWWIIFPPSMDLFKVTVHCAGNAGNRNARAFSGSVSFFRFFSFSTMLLSFSRLHINYEKSRQSHEDTYYTFLWQLYRFPHHLSDVSSLFLSGWRVHVRVCKVVDRQKKNSKRWTNEECCQWMKWMRPECSDLVDRCQRRKEEKINLMELPSSKCSSHRFHTHTQRELSMRAVKSPQSNQRLVFGMVQNRKTNRLHLHGSWICFATYGFVIQMHIT